MIEDSDHRLQAVLDARANWSELPPELRGDLRAYRRLYAMLESEPPGEFVLSPEFASLATTRLLLARESRWMRLVEVAGARFLIGLAVVLALTVLGIAWLAVGQEAMAQLLALVPPLPVGQLVSAAIVLGGGMLYGSMERRHLDERYAIPSR